MLGRVYTPPPKKPASSPAAPAKKVEFQRNFTSNAPAAAVKKAPDPIPVNRGRGSSAPIPKTPVSAPKVASSPTTSPFVSKPVSAAPSPVPSRQPRSNSTTSVEQPSQAISSPLSRNTVHSHVSQTSSIATTGTVQLDSQTQQQLNSSFQASKLGSDTISNEEKLKILLNSSNEQFSNNAIYIAMQMLDKGHGVPYMVSLLNGPSETISVNCCKAITNYANKDPINSALCNAGYNGIIALLRKVADKVPVLQLMANSVTTEKACTQFIRQGGLSAVIDVLVEQKKFEENNLALLITNNSIAAVKENMAIFAEEAICRSLIKAISARIDADVTSVMLRIMCAITGDDKTRTAWIRAGGIIEMKKLLADKQLSKDAKVANMLVRLIGNVFKDASASKEVIAAGAIEYLSGTLSIPSDDVHMASLATIANIALNDFIIVELRDRATSSGLFTQIMSLSQRTRVHDVKLRCTTAISNLMTIDTVQDAFEKAGGIKSLLDLAANSSENEDIRLKALSGLFHMSMYNDNMRNKIAHTGLKTMADLLKQPKAQYKNIAAKTLVNLSLSEATEKDFIQQQVVGPLVATLKETAGDGEVQCLVSMALENLAYNTDASNHIREAGGLDAAIQILNNTSSSVAIQERAAKFIAKLAVNSKNRKAFQDKNGSQALNSALAKVRDPNVKSALQVALGNMAVPHFEDDKSTTVPEKDEFDDLRGCGLGDEDDDDASEVEKPPAMPEDSDEEDMTQIDPLVQEVELEEASVALSAATVSPRGPPIPKRPLAKGQIRRPMAEDDEEKEQDIGLRKEQYMLSNAPVEEGGRKPRVSKFSKFLAKLKDAFVGTDEAEDVVIVPRASSVDESAITNRCHSILYDYYDYWCESCKRSGSTCYKEMTEIRHSRMQLIRDKIPKSFPPGTNVPEGVPFLPDKKTEATSSEVEQAPQPPESEPLPDRGPPPPVPRKPSIYRIPRPQTSPILSPLTDAAIARQKAAETPGVLYRSSPTPGALKQSTISPRQMLKPATNPPLPRGPRPDGSLKKIPPGAPKKRPIARPPPDADPLKVERAKMHFKRTKVAQELLETEGSYVKNLAIIMRKWQNPLASMCSSSKPLATDADVRTIFSCVEIILSINSMLLEGLNNKMRKWTSKQTLGDVFLYMGDFLKTYTQYINNYDAAQNAVAKCSQDNPRFQRWLEETRNDPLCKGLGLQSYLIMPVQRVPRYSLLLRELLKATPKEHEDYKGLTGASEKLDMVAEYLNSKKKDFEHRLKLIEIAQTLVGKSVDIVHPHREAVSEPADVAWEIKNNGQRGTGKAYCFNDGILITKTLSKNTQRLKRFVLFADVAGTSLGIASDPTFQILSSSSKDHIIIRFETVTQRDAFNKVYVKYSPLTNPERRSTNQPHK